MAIGTTLALGLLLAGIGLGLRLARRRENNIEASMSQNDREQVLRLLRDLGAWTSAYSVNVSDYQQLLGQLSDEIHKDGESVSAEQRIVHLLQQMMESNSKLQARLDVAEQQLEKQTQQIQCYLNEARTDVLTGLFNRRAFDQKLEELFLTYRGGGRSFVVVLIDIDRFKSINDTYGHQVGDRVLQQFAFFLRSQLDRAMIVARFGGEEFAVLLEGPIRVAAEKLNEFRKLVENQSIDAEAARLGITISVGISEPRDDLAVASILRRADEALYAAKHMGRNKVYFDDGRGPALVGAPEVVRHGS